VVIFDVQFMNAPESFIAANGAASAKAPIHDGNSYCRVQTVAVKCLRMSTRLKTWNPSPPAADWCCRNKVHQAFTW